MRTLILDANIVSYLMKGHASADLYRKHLEGAVLAISFMTVGELYEGGYRANWPDERLEYLERVLRSYVVAPYSNALSKSWGRIRARRRSKPISVDDAWIAATAVTQASPLVTHNPLDFQGIDDLTIVTEAQS